jgi:hypothetical protein
LTAAVEILPRLICRKPEGFVRGGGADPAGSMAVIAQTAKKLKAEITVLAGHDVVGRKFPFHKRPHPVPFLFALHDRVRRQQAQKLAAGVLFVFVSFIVVFVSFFPILIHTANENTI